MKVRIIYIFLLITSLGFDLIAQKDTTKISQKLGLGFPYMPYFIPIGLNTKLKPLCISYKRFYKKNVLRTGAYFQTHNNTYLNSVDGLTKYHSSISCINVGYERRFTLKKFDFIAGVDLGFIRWYKESHKASDQTLLSYYKLKTWGIGPILGIAYNFSKKLSIETECGFFGGKGNSEEYYINSKTIKRKSIRPRADHRVFSILLYYTF